MELDLLQEEEQALVSLGDRFLSLTDPNNSNNISWIQPQNVSLSGCPLCVLSWLSIQRKEIA